MEAARELIVETLGVFALVYVGGSAISTKGTALIGIGFAHALILGLNIIIAGPISGGQLNPAVTLALLITGNLNAIKGVLYIVAQIAGSFLAALCLKFLNPGGIDGTFPTPTTSALFKINAIQICLLEFIATFFLVMAVFTGIKTGQSERTIALMVGGTLLCFIQAIGPFTGASLNPCRTLGPAVITSYLWNHGSQWAYYVGPLAGGATAGLFSQFLVHSNFGAKKADPKEDGFEM